MTPYIVICSYRFFGKTYCFFEYAVIVILGTYALPIQRNGAINKKNHNSGTLKGCIRDANFSENLGVTLKF